MTSPPLPSIPRHPHPALKLRELPLQFFTTFLSSVCLRFYDTSACEGREKEVALKTEAEVVQNLPFQTSTGGHI